MPDRRRRWKGIAGAAVVVVSIACSETSTPAGAPRPTNLLLISVDTLRADHVGAYGYEGPISPALDRLAAEGAVFEDVTATSPWTFPSHASLLTGLYPSRHGARTYPGRLGDVPTLAEAFRAAGFTTGAVVNTLFLAEGIGMMRGVEWQRHVPETETAAGAAPEITKSAFDFLETHQDPFFLFVHYYDVHSGYHSMPRYRRMFDAGPGVLDGTTAQMDRINAGSLAVDASREGRRASLLYAAGVRQLDDHLHRLLGKLRLSGRLGRTLVVVTSDHGEAFLEHGTLLHGSTHYEEELRVPLILRGPGVPAGRRVEAPVSLVDVSPTLRGIFGLPAARESDGHDLRAFFGDEAPPPRPVFAEAAPALSGDTLRTVRNGRFKLIADLESGTRELYDLRSDPREGRNLRDERPEVLAELERLLQAHEAGRRDAPTAPPAREADLEKLRALGYVE
jgi:arylsulfatase A-like enzyme